MQDLTQLDNLMNESGMLFSRKDEYLKNILTNARKHSLALSSGSEVDCLFCSLSANAPNILYFHDPASKELTFLAETAKKFESVQLNFIAVEYCATAERQLCYSDLLQRGLDIVAGAELVLKDKECTGPIFAMGQSVGGNIALHTAVQHSDIVKGLILEDLICETTTFFRALYPENSALRLSEETAGCNCLKLIAELKSPTLFFHGAKDNLVSTRDAEKLQSYSGARTKQFFIIPGAERGQLQEIGGALYFETIKSFTDTVCGTNTWREKRRKFKAGLQ